MANPAGARPAPALPAPALPAPALPTPVPGLRGACWRPLTIADVGAYLQLHEAARVADGGTEVMTAEVADRELSDPDGPVATNSLGLALADGSLAASMLIHERLHGLASRRVFLWGVTRPDLRGRGIGTAILRWALGRADEILAGQPADLARLVEAFKDVRLADAVALHEAAGFRPVRWYREMRRDLGAPIPPIPDLGGVVIRPYDPALAEPLRLAHNEAFADHWGSEPITPEVWNRDFVGDLFFRGDLSFVAFDGPEIAAYTVNYVAESDWEASGVRDGWIGQLGVRRGWRRHGLATALLARSIAAFRAAGLEAATLGVDAENTTGALGLYERVGFGPIRSSVRLQRPLGG